MRPRLEKQNQVKYSNRSQFDRDLIILQRAIKRVPDWSKDEDWRLQLIMKQYENSNVYLLLAEFSVRTVNYGPSVFFHRFMAQARSVQAINRWKKRGSVIYSVDRKNEANKMFIIWLLRVWGTGNKCRTSDLSHLTGVKKEIFYSLTKTIAHNKGFPRKGKQIRHVEKVYLVKTKRAGLAL